MMSSALAALVMLLAPATQPTTIPHRAVGQVLGRTVYLDELGISEKIDPTVAFDASNEKLWGAMGRVSEAFGTPLIERFKKEQKIEATDEELRAFTRTMRAEQEQRLAEVKKEIASLEEELKTKELPEQRKKRLERELSRRKSELSTTASDEGYRSIGEHFIVSWKLQRDLHRKYGGRIIFQQFGPEALDGMRRLFEEAEEAGDLRIDDPGLRHLFYWYYKMQHTQIDDPQALEKPWFMTDAPATSPGR